MTLHSGDEPSLGEASSKLTYVLIGRLLFLTGSCWLGTLVSCHIHLLIDSLNVLTIYQLASPRVTNVREQKREGESTQAEAAVFYDLILSHMAYQHFCYQSQRPTPLVECGNMWALGQGDQWGLPCRLLTTFNKTELQILSSKLRDFHGKLVTASKQEVC